jgi:anti-sigma-K factor RskA
VSACRSRADLIGPYVLDALDPEEMDEMRRHLAGCPRCAAEASSLAGLPALLDRAEADAVAPLPSPELEEAVLDRFVRERAGSAPRRRRLSWRRLAIPAIAVAALALGIAVAAFTGGPDDAYASAELWGSGAAATAKVAAVDAGTHVELHAERLPVGGGKAYELWCIRTDGRWINGGSFHATGDGRAAGEFTAAVRPGEYHLMVVTRRSSGGERGPEVMRGRLSY